MTKQQIDAFRLIDSVLQPTQMAQVLQNGTRETWIQINNAVDTLRALLNEELSNIEEPPTVES